VGEVAYRVGHEQRGVALEDGAAGAEVAGHRAAEEGAKAPAVARQRKTGGLPSTSSRLTPAEFARQSRRAVSASLCRMVCGDAAIACARSTSARFSAAWSGGREVTF